MNDHITADLATFLLTLLCWWVLLSAFYIALLLGVDALLAAWERRQQARRHLRRELARIDREANVSVRRVGAAFLVAQQRIREERATGRRGRRRPSDAS